MKSFKFVALLSISASLLFHAWDGRAAEALVDKLDGTGATVVTSPLDKILTSEMAAEVAGFPAVDAKKDYKPDEKRPETEVVFYSWDNGRKKIAGTIVLPVMDTVKFGWVRKSNLAALKEQAAHPAFKDFTEVLNGVGDFALWNDRDKQLIVLSGEKAFAVWVNVSADETVNKAKSLELAKKLAGKF